MHRINGFLREALDLDLAGVVRETRAVPDQEGSVRQLVQDVLAAPRRQKSRVAEVRQVLRLQAAAVPARRRCPGVAHAENSRRKASRSRSAAARARSQASGSSGPSVVTTARALLTTTHKNLIASPSAYISR